MQTELFETVSINKVTETPSADADKSTLDKSQILSDVKEYVKLREEINKLDKKSKDIKNRIVSVLKEQRTRKIEVEDEHVRGTVTLVKNRDTYGLDEERFCSELIDEFTGLVDKWFEKIGEYLREKGIETELPKPRIQIIEDIVFKTRKRCIKMVRKGGERFVVTLKPKV